MEYRMLGASGTVVSSYALGTMTFGAETSEPESFAQLDTFAEAGGTLLDCADVYSDTRSEEIVGKWLAARPAAVRDQMVVATKGRFPTGPGPNDVGLSRRHLTAALDASLRRLGVAGIDLYQVHAWDPLTPLEETLSFLDQAQQAGKVHYLGLSNFIGWQLQKAADIAAFRGLARPVTLQQQYNLLTREIEWEVLPVCQNEGLGLLPWSPLGGGWLTGKYQRDAEPAGATRLGERNRNGVEAYARRAPQQRTWNVVSAVAKVAKARGASPAQVALAWLHDRPAVTAPVLGARTVEQLRDNLGAAGLHLSADETALLDEASAPETPDYPYGPSGVAQRSRPVTGGRAG
jgi:aryl-alcohol dehydrogenase-like predicted oxidoreductase